MEMSKKKQLPVLSMIIPVYNTSEFLRECFDSVLEQDGVPIEILAVNDGSSDNSPAIMEEYAAKYENFKAIHLEKNQGVSAARNAGLEAATGKYIGYLDSDDYLIPNQYAWVIETCEKHQLDLIRFSFENFFNTEEDRKKRSYKKTEVSMMSKEYSETVMTGQQLFLTLKENEDFNVNVYLCIVRKSLLDKKPIRFVKNIIFEDAPYSLEVILAAKRCMCFNKILMRRRIRDMSIEHRPPTPERAYGAFRGIAPMIDVIKDITWESAAVRQMAMADIKRRYIFASTAFRQLDKKQQEEMYRMFTDYERIVFEATVLPHMEMFIKAKKRREQLDEKNEKLKSREKEIKELKKKIRNIRSSKTFRVGRALVHPFSVLKRKGK